MIGKLWTWLNGKKLVGGSIITILGTIAEQSAIFLPTLIGPAKAAQYVGIATAVIGVLHKVYKFIYKEDHP